MKQYEKLIKEFIKTDKKQSEEIELDNLDKAFLCYNTIGEVVVENEHGTQFDVNELSKIEMNIFNNIL